MLKLTIETLLFEFRVNCPEDKTALFKPVRVKFLSIFKESV